MRVTQSIVSRNLLNSINQTQVSLSKSQNEISTGTAVAKSSDNPTSFAKATQYRNTIAANETYLSNIDYANGWIDNTSSLLDSIYEQVTQAIEVATSGADASNSASTRETLAEEVDGIIDEVMSLVNSTYLSKNVFAGTVTTGTDAFTYDGTSVTYNGNSESIMSRVAENSNIKINITGSQLEDTGIFQSLIDLRDALNSNDSEAVSTTLDSLNSIAENISSMTSSLGSKSSQLDIIANRLETANTNLESILSSLTDADTAVSLIEYSTAETAYQAALEIASEALNMSILNFID
jgi:flagellar hook-associated protein 3 FlgL